MGTEPSNAEEGKKVTASLQEQAGKEGDDKSAASAKLTPGTFVQIVNLKDHVWMEGRTGRLIEEKWGGKWLVDLDDEDGKRSQFRKRWLVPGRNIQVGLAKPVQYYQSATPPEVKFNLVGSWDNWSLKASDALKWDPEGCYVYKEIDIGDSGQASFQILVGCDWKRCIHPSRHQELDWQRCEECANRQASAPSSPSLTKPSKSRGMKLNFVGPDRDSHGKNWHIGQGQEQGARYEVRLTLWEDETVASMEIELKEKPENKRTYATVDPKKALYLVGSWNDWKPASAKRMAWDERQNCLKSEVFLVSDGLERFQVLMDRDWNLCMHPEKRNSGLPPADGWPLNTPDANGHSKDWFLGYDAVKGSMYEVRVRCWRDGTPALLEVSKPNIPSLLRCFMEEAPKDAFYLVGDFVDWKMDAAVEMAWNPEEKLLHAPIVIGSRRSTQEVQIVVNRSWQQCIHPDRRDISIDEHYKLCGPDHSGNGRNWLVGFDGDSSGSKWEVQLRLYSDGKPASVRAVRV